MLSRRDSVTATDLRHEYANLAVQVAALRTRMGEITAACGGGPPAGFCEVCGAALFPSDRPATDAAGAVTCGREGAARDFTAPCFYRPSKAGAA